VCKFKQGDGVMGRISAQERRESAIRAAVAEFALGGYYGTSVAVIAKRVGVTQPCLFPDKKAIFVAALVRSMEDTRLAFERAADGWGMTSRPSGQ
jgi:AcrR family transcriptional regulator